MGLGARYDPEALTPLRRPFRMMLNQVKSMLTVISPEENSS